VLPAALPFDDEFPAALETLPDRPAVFLVWPKDHAAQPYLARTSFLRRRLRRLLGARAGSSRLLDLRPLAARVEYWFTPSRLGATLLHYELARLHFPSGYERLIKLRPPALLKVLLSNRFPRTTVTTRLSGSGALHFGPFRSRAIAERFEQEVLDLFQVRRCPEDLDPAPGHPGCIYGEMMRCLRPCQQRVSEQEYASEARRLVQFLETAGASLLEAAAHARDRFCQELDFEQAARQHQRCQRIEQALRLREDLAAPLPSLHGAAVLPAAAPGAVVLRFLLGGVWLPEIRFSVAPAAGPMVPLDRRLRELVASLEPPRVTLKERQEHLAVLARWFFSSWRDGDWFSFDARENLPYRRLVRAISAAARAP
jgi:hypothetical protein